MVSQRREHTGMQYQGHGKCMFHVGDVIYNPGIFNKLIASISVSNLIKVQHQKLTENKQLA